MKVTNHGHVSDELWIGHHARQELIVVVGLQGLLLQQLSLLCLDGRYNRHLQEAEPVCTSAVGTNALCCTTQPV